MQSNTFEKGINESVDTEATLGSSLDALGDYFISEIRSTIDSHISFPKVMFGFVSSPTAVLSKFKYNSVIEDAILCDKLKEEGMFHITSEENAQKILESGYVKPTGYISSYGNKKSFFFAGNPSFEDVLINTSGFSFKCVAVKFAVDEEMLKEFRYRKYSDQAITHDGAFLFDANCASLVYLGLFEENGKLVYKEISKAQYDHFKTDISSSKINQVIMNVKAMIIGVVQEANYSLKRLQMLRDVFKNSYLKNTNAVIGRVNGKTNSILLKEEISVQTENQGMGR